MRVTVNRKAHFNAAHRLYRKDWTDAQNADMFGKCANANFHGHNYEVVVSVTGQINPETGYVIDLKELADIIYEEVELPFDHKNLNLDCPEFADLIPTAEYIAVVIWNKIRARIKFNLDLDITLYETPRNFVTYSGEN